MQRLMTLLGDGPEVYRRAEREDAEALITCAPRDTARASASDPGVVTRVRADGYYIVSEQTLDYSGQRPVTRTRVIARGHLHRTRYTQAQLHHIHAGQCPAILEKPTDNPDLHVVTHCGKRIDELAEHAPYCHDHKDQL